MARIYAPAKVNLYLHVGPVRTDGRHPLDSLVVFADHRAADVLTYSPSDAPISLSVIGDGLNTDLIGDVRDNLVMKSVRALEAASGRQLTGQLVLDKRLPIAAGIGGGSSDAAATLRLLNNVFDLGFSVSELMTISTPLGGDLPACVAGEPVLMRGDGDRIEAAQTVPPAFEAVLITPTVSCPTGPVFRAFDEAGGGEGFSEIQPPDSPEAAAYLAALASGYRNDLQAPATQMRPEISELLETLANLSGAGFSAMSGSGATCFALFVKARDADEAEVALTARYREYWVVRTKLATAGFDLSVQPE